jgi:hypothetical protein
MAVIAPFDDEYGGYRPNDTAGDYTQPSPSYESHQAPAYQAPAQSPTQPKPQSSYNNTGITGMGTPVFNWSDMFGQQNQPKPFDYGQFRSAAEGLGSQYSGSLDDFVNHIFPQLSQQFAGLERFGSKGDKIRLPNGEVIDAVISAGLGGRGYNWNPESPTSGSSYVSDPLMGQYIDRMNGLIDRLTGPQPVNPALQEAMAKLQAMFDAPMAAAPQVPVGYTDAQRAMLQTNVREPIMSARDAAQQRALERASARGIGLSSGVLQDESQNIDTGYDRMSGEALRQLAANELAMQAQQNQLNAQLKAATEQDYNSRRSQIASTMAGLGSGLQGQDFNALVQALGATSSLGQLPLLLQNQQIEAMNALNRQPIPQMDSLNPLAAILASLAGQGENAYNTNLGQNSNFWASLFGQIPNILNAVGGNSSSYPDMSGVPDIGYPHA